MVKIKICGITNLEDALNIAKLKPDALGFVFYKKSPRYIKPEKAKEIIKYIPAAIKKVGVFVNGKEKDIKRIAEELKLDILQFHGNESPAFCKRFEDYKILKALRIKDRDTLKGIKKYPVWGFLFDTYQKNLFGGTGKRFNWNLLESMGKIKQPVFLSGGLTVKNIKEAIRAAHPAWIDVSGSVELRPGRKDNKKAKEFIRAAKEI